MRKALFFLALCSFGALNLCAQCGPNGHLGPIGNGQKSCIPNSSIPAACATNPPTAGTAGQVCVTGTSQYLCHTTGACSVAGDWTLVGPGSGGPPTGAAGGSLAGTYPSPTLAVPATLSYPTLGTTPTDGLTLTNTTPAANGAQQWSPCFEQIGQGWATGTGLSTPVGFRSCVVPVQGTTTGSSYYGLFYHPPSGGDVLGLSMLPNGNVGIGTTSPDGILEIYAPSSVANNSNVISIHQANANPNALAIYNDTYSKTNIAFSFEANNDGSMNIGTNQAQPLNFYTNGFSNSRLSIDGNGSIQNKTPDSNTIFAGSAGVQPVAYASNGGYWAIRQDATNHNFNLDVAQGTPLTALTVNSTNGNVGIGTTGPVSKLHIGVAPTATPNYATLSIGSGPWDGATSGYFQGAAAGTHLGINAAAGSTADFANWQIAGVKQFGVDVGGNVIGGYFGTTNTELDLATNSGGGTQVARLAISQGNAGVYTGSLWAIGWSSSTTPSGAPQDTAFSRDSAGVIDVGTGAQGSKAGSMIMTATAQTPVLTTNLKTCTATTGTAWRAAVSDAVAPAIGVALTGGGAVFALVHCSLTTGTYIVDGI